MSKPQYISVSITVEASTDNPNDTAYHHCFERKEGTTLTFKVKTDPSVDTINFALWTLEDPINPTLAEPATDWQVDQGYVEITVGPDFQVHLGPGPYCAALTASSSTVASAAAGNAGTTVGNALYYYRTWKGNRNCKY